MPDKDMLAFLAGMKIYDADIEMRDDVVVAVATVGGPFMEYHSEEEHASWIVTAAHEYTERHRSRTHSADCWRWHPECAVAMIERWLPVIAMAREFGAETWERTADFLAGLWWAKGTVMEDMCRAITAALKEGNADG